MRSDEQPSEAEPRFPEMPRIPDPPHVDDPIIRPRRRNPWSSARIEDASAATLAASLGVALAAPPLIMYLVGSWLGRVTGWGDVTGVAGAVLGIAAGILQAARIIRQIDEVERRKKR